MRITYFSLNRLKNIIKGHKDTFPITKTKNVIYKISCKDCETSYVGQTGRQLKTRMTEHRNHIKRNTNTPSVITEHKLEYGHFDWDGVKIMDKESLWNKRIISEMLHISKQTKSLNLQSDTNSLHDSYFSIINRN